MSARENVLRNIRRSLGRGPLDTASMALLEASLRPASASVRPDVSGEPLERFCGMLERAAATVVRLGGAAEIPAAVAGFLDQHGLPRTLVSGTDPWIAQLPWLRAGMAWEARAPTREDTASFSHAFLGIAETGSLVLLGDAHNPSTLNFLPENHILAVDRKNVVRHLEDAWARLRELALPRAVHLIGGPSRTADIEQTMQLGAHGPRRLHVFLVQE
jgi:L-lactate dehydrogenase complex protein LldG